VDFGFKRIGLAIAEAEHGVISPRPFLEASGKLASDAERLIEMARAEQVDRIVLGMPLEDGEEGRMARICRTLAGHIRGGGFPVDLVDETLTSVEADARILGSSEVRLRASQRRKLKDGEAARLILERYLSDEERRKTKEEAKKGRGAVTDGG